MPSQNPWATFLSDSGPGYAFKLCSKADRQAFGCYLHPETLRKFLTLLSKSK